MIGPGAAFVFLLYIIQFVLTMINGAWGVWHEGGARRLREPDGAIEEPAAIAASS